MSDKVYEKPMIAHRKSLYQLVREYLYQLMFHSSLISNKQEQKALQIVMVLLDFVQGNHRYPHEDEQRDLISDMLDRNLTFDEISKKYRFSRRDSLVDLTESELIERLSVLEDLIAYQKAWEGWEDGK